MSVYIIAEAGVNHNGSVELAKKLIDAAVDAGVDCVKFQTFKAESMSSKKAKQAEYQKKNIGKEESQLDMLKKLELSYDDFRGLQEYCSEKNIDFLSTPFENESIDFLDGLGMKFWKIPSGEVTNLPYLEKIARTGKPVVLSTGMCTIDEISECIDLLRKNGAGDLSVLHCTTQYPTPFEDVNLNVMKTLSERFKVPVGYSDHTKGIEVPVAAVAMGAKIIEKHFTLDRNMEGPDHKASLEPDELKAMVSAIRNIEKALGSAEKKPAKSEIANIAVARKSIVAKKAIKKGEVFTQDNITAKRPGSGISPMKWYEVIGNRAVKDFEEDELISL